MTKVTIKTVEQLVDALEGAKAISEVEAILNDSGVQVLRSYAKAENYYFGKPLTKVTKAELVSAILGSYDGVFEVEPEAEESEVEAVEPVVEANPARLEEQYKVNAEVAAIRKQPFEEKMKLFNTAVEEHQDEAFTVLRKYFTFDEIYLVAVMMEVPRLVLIQSASQYDELLDMMRSHYATWYEFTHDTALMRARAIKRADIYGHTWGGAMQWDKLVYCIRIIEAINKADCSIKRYILELCDDETRYRICKALELVTPEHYAENNFATQSEYEEYLVISLEILLNQIMTFKECHQQSLHKAQEDYIEALTNVNKANDEYYQLQIELRCTGKKLNKTDERELRLRSLRLYFEIQALKHTCNEKYEQYKAAM